MIFSRVHWNEQQLCFNTALQNLDHFQVICNRFLESLSPQLRWLDQIYLFCLKELYFFFRFCYICQHQSYHNDHWQRKALLSITFFYHSMENKKRNYLIFESNLCFPKNRFPPYSTTKIRWQRFWRDHCPKLVRIHKN